MKRCLKCKNSFPTDVFRIKPKKCNRGKVQRDEYCESCRESIEGSRFEELNKKKNGEFQKMKTIALFEDAYVLALYNILKHSTERFWEKINRAL